MSVRGRYLKVSLAMAFAMLLSIGATAHDIQLRSDVVNGRLVPQIEVNGRNVLRIQDKGPKGRFESNFDRAEQIYLNLVELEEKGQEIGHIRVRRIKQEYTAYVGRNRIFTITKGDMLANNSNSAYQLASLWVQNVRDAVAVSGSESDGGVDMPLAADAHEIAVKKDQQERMFPLVFVLNSLAKSGVMMLIIQLLFLGVFQVLVAYGVVHYVMKRQMAKDRVIQGRLDKLQHSVGQLKQQVNMTQSDIKTIKKKTDRKGGASPLDMLRKSG